MVDKFPFYDSCEKCNEYSGICKSVWVICKTIIINKLCTHTYCDPYRTILSTPLRWYCNTYHIPGRYYYPDISIDGVKKYCFASRVKI